MKISRTNCIFGETDVIVFPVFFASILLKMLFLFYSDKNQGKEEECAAHFRIIQQAYDVLSDPQERAWYDKHREAILRGGK